MHHNNNNEFSFYADEGAIFSLDNALMQIKTESN